MPNVPAIIESPSYNYQQRQQSQKLVIIIIIKVAGYKPNRFLIPPAQWLS